MSDPKDPERKPMMTSSASRGMIRAPAKGHPTIAPKPNHMMPCAVFCLPRQSKNAASPSMDVYIVRVDGRKAVEAWNMPGLNATIRTNSNPMRGLSVRQMAEYSRVSQAAQTKARNSRIK